ncbi:MAG: hypothetical protein JWR19_3279 [Pedosphaera sp.]|jgi:hypothetical protein|nr:hypothetical protein [Pedosphaera sp.]
MMWTNFLLTLFSRVMVGGNLPFCGRFDAERVIPLPQQSSAHLGDVV